VGIAFRDFRGEEEEEEVVVVVEVVRLPVARHWRMSIVVAESNKRVLPDR
jgi:hypothetical protein